MGFLRFLSKKQERKADDELDIPPPPPSSMGMSGIDADLNAPFPGDELSSGLSFPKQASKPQGKELPSVDDFDFDIPSQNPEPPQSAPMMEFPKQASPIRAISPSQPQPVKSSSSETLEAAGNALYIEVGQFRHIVQDLSDIRSDLRKTEQVMEHMLATEANQDKDYARYRGLLNDTQRKLVFIDKTLFKGGAQ